MSQSYNLRRQVLEWMRLAADCRQLARESRSLTLQSHFLRMAEEWPTLANRDLSTGIRTDN